MSFDNWFNDEDDDFFEQLREMQKRVSHMMRKQLREILEALKDGEVHGQMHIKPIDGPGFRGYVMWGQLGDSPDIFEKKPKKLRSLVPDEPTRKKLKAPILAEAEGNEEEEEEEEELGELRKPLIEKFKSKNEYVVLAELPGIDESDLKVSASNGVLEISGGQKFRSTRIRLPPRADAKHMRTSYKNGILEVRIPQVEPE
jgi:HSP20 family molecular chaperone IbpA